MCGIFAYLGKRYQPKDLEKYYQTIKHRGPDNTKTLVVKSDLFFVFHRLMINGLDAESDEPIQLDDLYLICNGEIYNSRKLIAEHDFQVKTHNDCECILHLYRRYGIEKTCQLLDGVFAFVLYDSGKDKLYAARDPIGIRPMYCAKGLGAGAEDEIAFASESKALLFADLVFQFPPGNYLEIGQVFAPYYYYQYSQLDLSWTEEMICNKMRKLLTQAVDKRMMSDRKICTLLSGGLDSTLITALVKKHFPDGELNTYSIGMEGSVDLYYAQIAADYLKTNHHQIVLTENEFLDAIEKTIYQIESYCTTSVRASVGNYLVSLYIKKQNNDDTVVFCGDMSDEIFASYRGFIQATSKEDFYKENLRMVKDVHYFDVLRSDKSISGSGLEARVPFADKAFIDFVMSIPPEFKMFNDQRIEKYLLRKAFEDLLPEELIWRRKEAFSDGVSGHQRSWFEIIREFVDQQVSDEEYQQETDKYSGVYDKESYYYRKIFEKYYPGRATMIPYYWRHPFCQNLDPSARLLDCYQKSKYKG